MKRTKVAIAIMDSMVRLGCKTQVEYASRVQAKISTINEILSGKHRLPFVLAMRIERNDPDFSARLAMHDQIDIDYKQEISDSKGWTHVN